MQYLKLNKNKTFGFILNDKVSIFFNSFFLNLTCRTVLLIDWKMYTNLRSRDTGYLNKFSFSPLVWFLFLPSAVIHWRNFVMVVRLGTVLAPPLLYCILYSVYLCILPVRESRFTNLLVYFWYSCHFFQISVF